MSDLLLSCGGITLVCPPSHHVSKSFQHLKGEKEGNKAKVCLFVAAVEKIAKKYGDLQERDPLTMYV